MGNSSSKRNAEIRQKDLEERRKRLAEEKLREENELKERRKRQLESLIAFPLQAASRGYLGRQQFSKAKAIASRRSKIASEILLTEQTYVHFLEVLIEVFYKPLSMAASFQEAKKVRNFSRRKTTSFQNKEEIASYYGKDSSSISQLKLNDSKKKKSSITLESLSMDLKQDPSFKSSPDIPGITKEDIRDIFSQIEVICNYNQNIALKLQERIEKWHWTQQLGDIFLEMMDFLKVYIQYVNNYNVSLEKLEKLNAIPEFSSWLQQQESLEICQKNNISSLLIMPIQRIPRYVLLLEDLVRHSPSPHIDHENLTVALARMKDIAKLINEKKREAESSSIMLDLFNRLDSKEEKDDLYKPHRKCLKSGFLKEDGNPFYVVLFNDILLITKEKGSRVLKLVNKITLKESELSELPETGKSSNKPVRTFQITDSSKKPIILKAYSAEEKDEWFKSIQECIQQQAKLSSTRSINREAC